MAYNHIPEELIERARAVSVLEYFETYKPGDLHWYGKCFRSREHPSFCVMQGGYVFDWKSQGITGYGALDYLKKCEGYDLNKQEDFKRAVEILTNTDIELVQSRVSKSNYAADRQPKLEFCLPEKAFSNSRAINYLRDRALSKEVINYCIQKGLIYQSKKICAGVLGGRPLHLRPVGRRRNDVKAALGRGKALLGQRLQFPGPYSDRGMPVAGRQHYPADRPEKPYRGKHLRRTD